GTDSMFFNRRVQITTLAARHVLPAIYNAYDYAEAGGLMSYGTSLPEAFRQTGVYAGRIIKGEKPADLPVVQSAKFVFCNKSADCARSRPQRPPDTARPRRRGDRINRSPRRTRCCARSRPVMARSGGMLPRSKLVAFGAERT